MLLQSLHTHSLYDDGQDTLARMAQNAEAAGLDALGFSGHSPLPFANDWAIDQSCLADYLREARSLQAVFRGRCSLYCGLEWDSCSPLPEQKLDYLIGSVHYFPALPDGTRFTVDGSAQLLAQCAQVQCGGDMAAQADCYYALVARLAEVPQVDIVGHFDLITKFDEPHTRYPIVPPSARAAMERLIRAGKVFEIYTGASRRGYRQPPSGVGPRLASSPHRCIAPSHKKHHDRPGSQIAAGVVCCYVVKFSNSVRTAAQSALLSARKSSSIRESSFLLSSSCTRSFPSFSVSRSEA